MGEDISERLADAVDLSYVDETLQREPDAGDFCLCRACQSQFLIRDKKLWGWAQAGCSLNFTSPAKGAKVTSPNITVYGSGGGDATTGDAGTVTATLNGSAFFNYSGSFTAIVSFLEGRGVPVTLRPGPNYLAVSGSSVDAVPRTS